MAFKLFRTSSQKEAAKSTTPTVTIQNAESDTEAAVPSAPEWAPTVHEKLIMGMLSIISLMVALDACVIVTSLTAIVEDLGGNATQGFWVGTSYLLTNAVTMPIIAAISDIFGRPTCLMAALGFFTIGTLLCCLANTITLLLVGRCLQGIGGGGIVIISLVIFTDIVPLRHRPKWYGTVLGAWALGNCIGPIVGGVFVQDTTWRWVFYVMFPFCVFGLVSVPWLLTLEARRATLGEKLARVDWTGTAMFMASMTSFLIAISWGGSQYEWSSAATLAPLLVGLVGLVVTCVWEAYIVKEPFLRHSLFWGVSPCATYFCGMVQGLIIYGQLYYVPFYFLSVKGYTPINTGLALLAVAFTLVPGSIVTGALVTKRNNYRWAIWLGWALLLIGSALTLIWDADTAIGVWAITLVILGFGHGGILNAQNFATQAAAKGGLEGPAAAMYGFFRQLGMAIGVGVGGSAFQNVMKMKLRWEGLPEAIAENSEAFVSQLNAMPDGSEAKRQIQDAYVFGFRGVYAVYVALAGVAFIVSFFIRHYDMNKELGTEHRLSGSRLSQLIENRVLSGRASPADMSEHEQEREKPARADTPGSTQAHLRAETPESQLSAQQEKLAARMELSVLKNKRNSSNSSTTVV